MLIINFMCAIQTVGEDNKEHLKKIERFSKDCLVLLQRITTQRCRQIEKAKL